MAMTTAAAHALALNLFNNTAWTTWTDGGGVAARGTAGSLYVSAHTANPGVGGDQTTSEANYGGYGTRPGVTTSGATGWTVGTGGAVSNTAAIALPACSSGSSTITYQGLGSAATAAGNLSCSGAITSPAGGLAVSTGITPSWAIGAFTVTVS
jgi:hypothetical protein